MTREIHNTPHQTPNPDGPHAVGSTRGAGTGAGHAPNALDEPDAEEPNYDSCTDHLNVILSNSNPDPDPALRSKGSADAIPRSGQVQEASAPAVYAKEGVKQPRTSEVFRTVGPQGGELVRAAESAETWAEPETLFDGNTLAAEPEDESSPRAVELASDDDHGPEPGFPWALLILMSYSSAVTLALTWVLWTGRTFWSAERPAATVKESEAEGAPKTIDFSPSVTLPLIARQNVARLGETIRLGDLEVTPIDISNARIDLVRSLEPTDWRHEDSPALVLRLKLTNVAADKAFAPLEARFVREHASATVDRSTLVTADGKVINLYPLAMDSEWAIVGQEFAPLKPGESVETIIASQPGAESRLTDETTWRVLLRIDPSRTDFLGVRFNKVDVSR